MLGGTWNEKEITCSINGNHVVLAACGGGEKHQVIQQVLEIAEKLFGQKCSSCHGTDLKGNGNFPNLTKIGSKLDQAGIENIINDGQGNMPKGQLTGEDVTTVAKWLSEKK